VFTQCGSIHLANRFTDPEDPRYVWNPKLARDVPADGLGHFLKELWSIIKSNKDLDLPMQKVMLAVHRCTQISEECYAVFAAGRDQLQQELRSSSEPLPSFGAQATALVEAALEEYSKQALRYEAGTRDKKAAELREKLYGDLLLLFHDQLRKIRNKVSDAFERGLREHIPDTPEPVANFREIVVDVREAARLTFHVAVKG